MDASKAAGFEGIHSAIVNSLAEVLVKICTQLFNASLDEGWLRAVWLMPTDIWVHNCGTEATVEL